MIETESLNFHFVSELIGSMTSLIRSLSFNQNPQSVNVCEGSLAFSYKTLLAFDVSSSTFPHQRGRFPYRSGKYFSANNVLAHIPILSRSKQTPNTQMLCSLFDICVILIFILNLLSLLIEFCVNTKRVSNSSETESAAL